MDKVRSRIRGAMAGSGRGLTHGSQCVRPRAAFRKLRQWTRSSRLDGVASAAAELQQPAGSVISHTREEYSQCAGSEVRGHGFKEHCSRRPLTANGVATIHEQSAALHSQVMFLGPRDKYDRGEVPRDL